MSKPKVRPVCPSEALRPIVRQLLSPEAARSPEQAAQVLAYLCGSGHIFMIMQGEVQVKKTGSGA